MTRHFQFLRMLVIVTVLICLLSAHGCHGLRLRKSMKTNMSLADLLFTRLNRFSLAKRNQKKDPPILAIPRLPVKEAMEYNSGIIPEFVNNVVNVKTKFIEDSIKAVNPFPQTLHQVPAVENYYNDHAGFGAIVGSEPGLFVSSKLVNSPKDTTPITTPVHSSKIFLDWDEAFAFEHEGREMKSEKVEAIKFVPWKNQLPSESVDNNSIVNTEWENSETLIDNVVSEDYEVEKTSDLELLDSNNFGTEWIVMEIIDEEKTDANDKEYTEEHEFKDYETLNDEYLGIADRRFDSNEYSDYDYNKPDVYNDDIEYYNGHEEITDNTIFDDYLDNPETVNKDELSDPDYTKQEEVYIDHLDDYIGYEEVVSKPINEEYLEVKEPQFDYDEYYADIEGYHSNEDDIYDDQTTDEIDEDIYHPDLGYFGQGNVIADKVKNILNQEDIGVSKQLETVSYNGEIIDNNIIIEEIINHDHGHTEVKIENITQEDNSYSHENQTNNIDKHNNGNHPELDELKEQLINLENMMLKTKEKIKDLYSYDNIYTKSSSKKRHINDYNKNHDDESTKTKMPEITKSKELRTYPTTEVNNIKVDITTTMSNLDPSTEDEKANKDINVTPVHFTTNLETEITTEISDIESDTAVNITEDKEEITTESIIRKYGEENIPTIPPSLIAMNFVTLDTNSAKNIGDHSGDQRNETVLEKTAPEQEKTIKKELINKRDDEKNTILDISEDNIIVEDFFEMNKKSEEEMSIENDNSVNETHAMPTNLAMTAYEEENVIPDDFIEKSEDMFYLPAGHGLLYGFKLKDLQKLKRTKLDIFHKSEINQNV